MRTVLIGAVLVACGGSPSDPDAPGGGPVDAALSDGSPDAASDLIHIHVQREGEALADIHVLFHDASGALIARTVTDATGDAMGEVPDGSMTTVVFPAVTGAATTFDTIVGIAHGDSLVFGSGPRPPVLDATATVPTYTGPETSLVYEVAAPCMVGDSPTTTVPLQATCVPPAHGPAVAVVADLQGPGGFYVVAYQDQADVDLPPAASLDFAGAWLAPVTQTFSVTNVPPGAEIGLAKTWYRDGQPYFRFGRTIPGVTSGSIPGPGGGDAWRAQTVVCRMPAIQQCQYRFHDLADPLDFGDDFAANRTAWLDVPTLTLGDRATIAWTADIAPDATAFQTRVTEHALDGTPLARWNVLQPAVAATAGTVTLPELPADLADLWIGITTEGYAQTEIDRTETLTYAELRARWFSTPLGELELAQVSVSQLP